MLRFDRLLGEPNIDQMKKKRNTDGLRKALSHDCTRIRVQAARALGEIADSQTIGS